MQNRDPEKVAQRRGGAAARRRFTWMHGLCFALGILFAWGAGLAIPWVGEGSCCENAGLNGSLAETKPWGELEYTTLQLEVPDESFPDVIADPEPFRWHFEGFTEEDLRRFIQSCDLSVEQKTILLHRGRWERAATGWVISPPFELVRDMSMPARKRIYEALKRTPLNSYMQEPCQIEANKLDIWLANSGLSPDKQELFRKVVFREGEWVFLYDGLLFEWLCREPVERVRMAKALTRTETILMKLQITPNTDVGGLLKYWGQGGRGEAMRPFLEGLKEVPGGTTISVSYLFPAFARMRLFTYPDVRLEPSSVRQDCIWTAMNFFSETPKPEYLAPQKVGAKLLAEYREVRTNFTFGDVMVLQNPKEIVHMCVYVADDVVFTKNGSKSFAPWILMKREQMLKLYDPGQKQELRVFRRKAGVQNGSISGKRL